MSKVVVLPFDEPRYKTFQYAVAACVAFTGDPYGEIQIFNQCTDIGCQRDFLKGWSSPRPSLKGTALTAFGNIFRYSVYLRYAKEYCNFIIHSMLDDGKFVYFVHFDEYYLPGKGWYGVKHFEHDGIIFGYDDNEKTYAVLTYDTDWRFGVLNIPQEAFEKSMRESFDEGYEPLIVGIISKKVKIELDVRGICERLKRYISSDFEKYPPEKDGLVEGIVTYDYLAMYIDRLLDGRVEYEKMDWRILRAVWEFRICMRDRLAAVEKKLGLCNSYSEEYSKLVDETNRLRMLYAVCHKKRRDSILISVRDGLLSLKEKDKEILQKFIKDAQEAIENESLEIHT